MTDAAEARDKRWIALILLCSAQFVVVLDASIVNVALPTSGVRWRARAEPRASSSAES
jgi:hypothetical protein